MPRTPYAATRPDWNYCAVRTPRAASVPRLPASARAAVRAPCGNQEHAGDQGVSHRSLGPFIGSAGRELARAVLDHALEPFVVAPFRLVLVGECALRLTLALVCFGAGAQKTGLPGSKLDRLGEVGDGAIEVAEFGVVVAAA